MIKTNQKWVCDKGHEWRVMAVVNRDGKKIAILTSVKGMKECSAENGAFFSTYKNHGLIKQVV